MRRAPLVLLLALAVALAAGCVTKAPNSSPTNSTNSSTDMSTMTPQAVTVTVGEGPTTDVPPKLYTLSPANLKLQVNMTYNLTLKNSGQNAHDLKIDGLNVTIPQVPGGGSKSVTFTPMQTGTFDMYCTIGAGTPLAHKDNGMSGKVTVS